MKSCKLSLIGLNIRELLGDMASRNSNIRCGIASGCASPIDDSKLRYHEAANAIKRAKKYGVASAREILRQVIRDETILTKQEK